MILLYSTFGKSSTSLKSCTVYSRSTKTVESIQHLNDDTHGDKVRFIHILDIYYALTDLITRFKGRADWE